MFYTERVCSRIFEIIAEAVTVRSSRPEVFCKKDILKMLAKFTRIYICGGARNLQASRISFKQGTLAQAFFYGFCEQIFLKKIFLRTAVSVKCLTV